MTPTDPGRVLRRALLAWGIGHFALGRPGIGAALLGAEVIGVILVAWLTAGLSESSAYLVPFMAGILFLVAWAWQAIAAYRAAAARDQRADDVQRRAPGAALGWLGVPLLVWGTGFWIDGARCATPAAAVDRSIAQGRSETSRDEAAQRINDAIERATDQSRDLRIRIADEDDESATALGELIHFERTETTILGIFPATELNPVVDRAVLTMELEAQPVELPGGGEIGAVCWELVSVTQP